MGSFYSLEDNGRTIDNARVKHKGFSCVSRDYISEYYNRNCG